MDSATIGTGPVTVMNPKPRAPTTTLSRGSRSIRPITALRQGGSHARQRWPQRPLRTNQSQSAPTPVRPPWLWQGVVASVSLHAVLLFALTIWRWVVVANEEPPIWFEQPVELLRVANISSDPSASDHADNESWDAVDWADVPLFTPARIPLTDPPLPDLAANARAVTTPLIAVDVDRAPRGVQFAVKVP
ncbi:MAG: hypothetical protein RMM51_05655, partial [Verrucomicrobiae bacterium]|nr:hypothetical protein [Verrucomicrobiae bacterium]